MPDREKVELGIKACWSEYFSHKCCDCPYMSDRNDRKCVERLGADALAMLKEQEDEKKRIMKVIWDTLHEGLSIDTVADQDWVYERIRHRIEDTYKR